MRAMASASLSEPSTSTVTAFARPRSASLIARPATKRCRSSGMAAATKVRRAAWSSPASDGTIDADARLRLAGRLRLVALHAGIHPQLARKPEQAQREVGDFFSQLATTSMEVKTRESVQATVSVPGDVFLWPQEARSESSSPPSSRGSSSPDRRRV